MGMSINDITHLLRGKGDQPKGDITPSANLVKCPIGD